MNDRIIIDPERCSYFHEPLSPPQGFGLRQSFGALGSDPGQVVGQKRQMTAAVQDAVAPN